MNGHFEVSLTWEVEEGVDIELVVAGAYATGGGNRSGHPDTWTEPWTELEIGSIKNEHGCPLPEPVVAALKASRPFGEEVIRRIEQSR